MFLRKQRKPLISTYKALGLQFLCVTFHEAVIILEVTGGHAIQSVNEVSKTGLTNRKDYCGL